MAVSEIEFQTYAVHIRNDLKGSAGKIHHALKAPAQFNALRSLMILGSLGVMGLRGLYLTQTEDKLMSISTKAVSRQICELEMTVYSSF